MDVVGCGIWVHRAGIIYYVCLMSRLCGAGVAVLRYVLVVLLCEFSSLSTPAAAAAGMVLLDLLTIVGSTSLTWVDPSRTGTPPDVVPHSKLGTV